MFNYVRYFIKIIYNSNYMIKLFKFLLIIIIIIFYLISTLIESHYKINYHKYWNPNLYKLPAVTNIDNININNINKGKQIANNSNIVICGLARNISKHLEDTKIKMEYIGKQFKNYKILIFENDSEDNTRELLKKWSIDNLNIILLDCCQLNDCECKLKKKKGYEYGTFSNDRLKNMAIYRQQYINYINKNLSDYDYMLVTDFDLIGVININGLYDSLSKNDWDGIFCNGTVPMYGSYGLITVTCYDALALIINKDDPYKNDLINLIYRYYIVKKKSKQYHYLPVISAFNGYGIYKIKSIKDCTYIGNSDLCEHLNFNKCLIDKNSKLFINFKWIGYFDIQGDNPFKIIYELLSK